MIETHTFPSVLHPLIDMYATLWTHHKSWRRWGIEFVILILWYMRLFLMVLEDYHVFLDFNSTGSLIQMGLGTFSGGSERVWLIIGLQIGLHKRMIICEPSTPIFYLIPIAVENKRSMRMLSAKKFTFSHNSDNKKLIFILLRIHELSI